MNPPKIFISATSGDLSSARQMAKEALLTINCHPVEQTNFEPDWRSVTDMLRGKIGDCQALIHLVGFRYGAEPDPATLPPGTPRRSYTQMEYHLARELGLRVYTFLLRETYPFDVPAKADTPEQTQRQAAHRALIQSSPRLYEKPANDLDLRTRIIALQEKVIHLEQEQQSIAKEVKTTRYWGLWAAAAILLILVGIGVWQWQTKKHTTAIVTGQTELAAQMTQVQAALSRIQQSTDRKQDPIGKWPQERLENELAQQMNFKVKDLHSLLAAGKTSLDALVAGQAFLASGKQQEAGQKFDTVIAQEQSALQRLQQAYAGKAQIAYDKARYEEALDYRQKAVALADKSTEPIAWAEAQGSVTFILHALARYKEAEPLNREILRLREQHLGPTHAATATALNDLAQLLQETNRLTDAEPLMRRALKIDEASLGLKHPTVARDLNNLAELLMAANRLTDAEPLMQRGLAILENKGGEPMPHYAAALNNLAQLLQATNRPTEAELLFRRALVIDEASYGPDHPTVAIRLGNLARLCQALGRMDEAEPLSRRAVGIMAAFQRSTGHEHSAFRTISETYHGLLTALKLPEEQINTKLIDVLGSDLAPAVLGPFLVTITEVIKGGQSEALGLQAGDAIVGYNRQAIINKEQLSRLISESKGEAIPLEVLRTGNKLSFTAKPGKIGIRSENRALPPSTGAAPAK